MKLILNMSGMMAKPSALRITSRGIPVLGLRVISLRDLERLATVASGSFWARAGDAKQAESRMENPTTRSASGRPHVDPTPFGASVGSAAPDSALGEACRIRVWHTIRHATRPGPRLDQRGNAPVPLACTGFRETGQRELRDVIGLHHARQNLSQGMPKSPVFV